MMGLYFTSVMGNVMSEITYTKFKGPVNLLSSMPPKLNSPLVTSMPSVGSNEIPISCASMRP